jgi:epoxyqueuosine reductase
MDAKQQELRRQLQALGFDDVRFVSIDAHASAAGTTRQAVEQWLAAGMHGDMHWMERTAEKRITPDLVLPGAQSIVMLGVNYWGEALAGSGKVSGHPIWARYALYEDYHDTISAALRKAGRVLEELYGVTSADYRYYVDTGPVLERSWAARSGIGFVGKNAMLISPRHGNWLFLAAVLTKVAFTPDQPVQTKAPASAIGSLCGTCTRCLSACPTNAFPQPGVVDARRCISYQTIENKGVIPRELRPGIGNRIYGCDICLEVCPWNRFAQQGHQMLLSARYDLAGLTLPDILALTPPRFAEVFRRTIKRLKLTGLLRNACVVAGNSGERSLIPLLLQLAIGHEAPLVRAHAVWAVFRLGGGAGLQEARKQEHDPVVSSEYSAEGVA